MTMLARARPDLIDFRAYVSARSTFWSAPIRLDANEAPCDADGRSDGRNRYPDPRPETLRRRLGVLLGVDARCLWVGRGSDEAIDLLLRAFCRAGHDNVVAPAPTFGMYRVAAAIQGAQYRELPTDPSRGFALDPERLLALVDADTKLVIVCSPNNPTGSLWHEAIDALASRLRGRALLVVDEAYIEFAGVPSASALLPRHDNLAVLRTLSKAHALAAARVGALIAPPDVIDLVSRIAAPYPLPASSIALAEAALEPRALEAARARIALAIEERGRVVAALASLPTVEQTWPSAANFVLARFDDGHAAFRRALAAGVLVRDVGGHAGLANCLRITIGSRHENDALLQALAGDAGSAVPGATA
jgi:histidinol-phosphate aminotransferase